MTTLDITSMGVYLFDQIFINYILLNTAEIEWLTIHYVPLIYFQSIQLANMDYRRVRCKAFIYLQCINNLKEPISRS